LGRVEEALLLIEEAEVGAVRGACSDSDTHVCGSSEPRLGLGKPSRLASGKALKNGVGFTGGGGVQGAPTVRWGV
jgi:hypothetical protein